jgi:hypothetical protein
VGDARFHHFPDYRSGELNCHTTVIRRLADDRDSRSPLRLARWFGAKRLRDISRHAWIHLGGDALLYSLRPAPQVRVPPVCASRITLAVAG